MKEKLVLWTAVPSAGLWNTISSPQSYSVCNVSGTAIKGAPDFYPPHQSGLQTSQGALFVCHNNVLDYCVGFLS